MDKKLVITIVIAVLIAVVVVWGFSVFTGPQSTGSAVTAASSPASGMVGGC